MSIGPVAPMGAVTTNARPATTERRPAPETEAPPPRESPADRVELSSTAGRREAPELKLSFEQLQQMVTKREPRAAAKADAAPRSVEPAAREAAPRPEPARQTPAPAPAADAPTPDRAARSVKPTPRPADTADGS